MKRQNELKKHPAQKLKVLDLFCGCGGMSMGLRDAGFEIVGAIDIWDKAVDNYRLNFSSPAICADLTSLSPEEYDSTYITNKEHQLIDLIVGGPPCQGLSNTGRSDQNDPRNSLFVEFVRYLNYFRPKAFIMENVISILSMLTDAKEKVIDIIMQHLSVNYNCIICKLCASDFEVPQSRHRTIIIGIRKDLKVQPIDPPTVLTANSRIPVKTTLHPREEVHPKYFLSERAIIDINQKQAQQTQAQQTQAQQTQAHFLNLDQPSHTINARYWKNGYDALVKYSATEIRRLTVTELKRIQSFPETFTFSGTKKNIIIQLGNAVAPRFAYHLGNYIINILK